MARPETADAPSTVGWRKILCAVDFSPSSTHAVQLAARLAQRFGAELTLLHVHEPPRDATIPPVTEEGEREVQRNLARAKLEARQFLDAPIPTKVLVGAPADEILSFAWQGRFDVIVTGTHGRSGVRRLVLGSVAEQVVRRAPCPVLVARPMSVAPSIEELAAEDAAT